MNLNQPDVARDELIRAVESGQPETIARVAMFNVWPLLTSHTELLITSVATLHDSVLDRYPALRLVHPMTAVLSRTSRAFKPRVDSGAARSMTPEEVDFVVLSQLIAFRASGDIESALVYAGRLLDRVQSVRIASRDRIDGPLWFFHHQIGSTFLAAGDSAGALRELAMARQLGKLSAQFDAERTALGRIALAHAFRGALVDAELALGEARMLDTLTPAHATSCISTENTTDALIAVDRMSDDVDERIAALAPYDSTDLTWPFALLARTRALLFRQHPDDALEAIRLARESHSLQPGCFASDVVDSGSIDALVLAGDVSRARAIVASIAEPGVLTRLAAVRLALRQGASDDAALYLRVLGSDQSLGPAQRGESVVLAGWLEFVRSGDLDRDTALRMHRVIRKPENRRIIALMPRQLVACVRARLDADMADEFDVATAGVEHFEMNARPVLTAGELRVLHALRDRASTATMAQAFEVSPNTIKSQLRSIYTKLGCSTREDALRIAEHLHILTLDEG
ncbi:helix-turn-helix transcriptional regulator [Agromyces atrinae]|uniref:DNA-binding CsgD family transcriptional regulator n=1 Tax=Agromyces atrinae TaxID=592376 RepID=A0A4Q2M7A5_9MICO|nr:LuxR C-terminal-related transcriptional regulator [Agromyces atrinae]NYD67688.1 DNA-binding CsgD family transcriptional regulator [Agromyces atrinae]RXZ88115.1 hypothetical protein ESP50_02715 [Agromyces atrinae]